MSKNLFKSGKLFDALKKRGLSYKVLSERMNSYFSEIGVETQVRPSNVSSWINGSDISGSYLFVLSKVLEIPMEQFFTEED